MNGAIDGKHRYRALLRPSSPYGIYNTNWNLKVKVLDFIKSGGDS